MLLRSLLAKNLQRLRRERGMSQEALADLVGIDRTYVSALERKIYSATIDVVERLAGALSVQPIELLTPAAIATQDESDVSTIRRPRGRVRS